MCRRRLRAVQGGGNIRQMAARSSRRMLRMALLLVVMLGIAAQSLVAVVGGIHELASGPTLDAHGHAGQHLSHEEEAPAGLGGHAAAEGSLHVLLHHSHCAHGAWMAGSCSLQLVFSPLTADLPPESAGRIPSFTPSTPFRPPIAA